MKPMKLTDVGIDVEPYITNPDWIMQQKHDGARMVVIYETTPGVPDSGELTFLNGAGGEMSFSAAKLKLPALVGELGAFAYQHNLTSFTLDGELIIEDGVYHVFDIIAATSIYGGIIVTPQHVLAARLGFLENYLGDQFTLLKPAVTARSTEAKRALWAAVNEAAVEGAISKHLGSLWIDGVTKNYRTKDWVKHKLVKTADVVVTSVERTFKADGVTLSHGKAELAVPIALTEDPEPYVNAKGKRMSIEDHAAFGRLAGAARQGEFGYVPRSLLPVGNASLIGKELTIDIGSVVEVNYLYWTGTAMIQPRIVRQRFDKPVEACDLAQFPAYTRAVVTLGDSEGPREAYNQPATLDAPSITTTPPSATDDGPRTGRGPSGKLRNFDAMGDAKFAAEAAKVEAENNDPEALEAVRASRASRAGA